MRLTRRGLLELLGGATLGAWAEIVEARQETPAPVELQAVPRVNGGINVQPLRRLVEDTGFTPPLIRPDLVDLQMKLVYELGFEWIRLTISFNRFGPDFLAAIPYVRAARALGINVLGVIGQFTGFDLVQALSRPDTREEVLDVYQLVFDDVVPVASPAVPVPGRFAAQVLNEPTQFLGIPPDVYVRKYLAPSAVHLKEDDPSLLVVSAATVGSLDGLLRTRALFESGVEHFCDRVAYHLYSRALIPHLRRLATRPVWVTESGIADPARHLEWVTDTFARIRDEIDGVENIFYFDLFDREPQRFRLVDVVEGPEPGVFAVIESSTLIQYFLDRVSAAGGGAPRAGYHELIPDITRYFPSEEDFRLIASTSYGRRTWRF